jgi:hypothetical protein
VALQALTNLGPAHVNPVPSGAVGKDCQRRLLSRPSCGIGVEFNETTEKIYEYLSDPSADEIQTRHLSSARQPQIEVGFKMLLCDFKIVQVSAFLQLPVAARSETGVFPLGFWDRGFECR